MRHAPPERRSEPAFQAALRHWLDADPGEALSWLNSHDDLTAFQDTADAVVLDWTKADPLNALASVLDLPPGERRDHWLAGVVQGLADYDPRLAGDYARDLLPTGEARSRALEGVATIWANHDPAAAAGWAFSLEQAGGPDVAGLVLYPWFSEARTDVAHWVGRLPPSPARDRLLTRMIGWQLEKNPMEAGGLLDAISDPKLKTSMTTAWVRQWAEDDFSSAAAWVRNVSAPALRERLVAALDASSRESADPRR